MNNSFICPKCGNKDSRYIGYKNNEPYCRLCITFQGKDADVFNVSNVKHEVDLAYPLSKPQEEISNQIIENFKSHKNSLIHAVCGSGKTELIYGIITYALNQKYKVGFAVPRREVVIDLLPRFLTSYPKHIINAVYGGNSEVLEGDIVLMTTHQLYRYNKYFDLLILDEIDAFPFKDNLLLINLFRRSCKGNYILMSATPPNDIVNEFNKNKDPILKLHTRYHNHPLPVPSIKISIGYFKLIFLIKKIKEYKLLKKQVMIFAPTISKCIELFSIIKIFIKSGNVVHSKATNRARIVQDFKDKKYDYLFTTSILERGVTIKNVQVIIYDSDSSIYDKGVLIQISGRVGRKIDAPNGEVIFLANKKTQPMLDAIKEIKYDNTFLQGN